MTNYEKITAVLGGAVGQTFTTTEIKELVKASYPNTNDSSIMPGDMAHDDTRYADKLFVSVGRSQYKVLPESDRKHKQSTRGTRSVDRVAALESGLSKLKPVVEAEASATE